MKLIDRYIIQELFVPFLGGIAAFTFILAGSTVLFNLIGEAIKYHIPVLDFLMLFFYKLPYIIALSFPMATLLATILVFGRMGNDLEILALKASGVGVLRLVVPVIVAGFVVSVLTILFNESIVPKASYSAENLMRSFKDQDKPSTIKKNINITEYKNDLPQRIINVGEVENQHLKSITVAEYDQGSLVRLIRAKSGRFLPEGGWEFYNGVMHNFPLGNPKQVVILEFKKELVNIQVNPLDLTKRQKNVEEMTRSELKQQIELDKKMGKDPSKQIMDYHMKLSVAFASLIYSILGASVGLRPHRSSSAMGLGLSLFIIFIYIILLSIGMGLGLSQTLPAMVAAWFPNIVIGISGIILLNKAALR